MGPIVHNSPSPAHPDRPADSCVEVDVPGASFFFKKKRKERKHEKRRRKIRWPIKDINFILVLIVFLSLSTTEEMFSPRNYTFLHGIKLFSAQLNFTPRNYTFHHGGKSCDREPQYGCAQPRMWMQTSTVETDCIHMKSIEEVKFSPWRKDFFPRWKV